ncbi:putative inorganic phosphate cotransporter [Schistocerca americana]|uniref:putative inorganic phosphate cotransporter n=1 Tax=Schistocerca americana TaxID=7009 RepID=UPI001F4FB135|nr:putative inorganic phosphate cotransporter [Schistocerca americana]
MSVAVVVMANNTAGNPNIKDYGWSQSETSTILSSFFWGYVVMMAPAGWAADRFNSKNLFSASIILSGILTMLTEVAADTGGVVLVCAFRVVMGLAQGFVFPCTHSLLAKWIPPKESDVLGTAVYTAKGRFSTTEHHFPFPRHLMVPSDCCCGPVCSPTCAVCICLSRFGGHLEEVWPKPTILCPCYVIRRFCMHQ